MWQVLSSLLSSTQQARAQEHEGSLAVPAEPAAPSRLHINDAALVALSDTLRQLNLDQDGINVPRIAVVGVQSSGKSSVLESLTGIPFPRDSTTCTRGPIEVRLKECKRESEEKIRVYKQHNDFRHNGPEAAEPVEEFAVAQDMSQDFAQYIQRTMQEMLLEDSEASKFTDSTLVVEVYRVRQIQFTVIDLPGYFQCTSSTDRMQLLDKQKVHSMIDRFIAPPSTLILHVIPANVDPLTLESWKECNRHDRDHKRTIGVLTKFDVAGDEYRDQWMQRMLTRDGSDDFSYQLGLYVLRCRSAEETRQGVTWEEMRSIERQAVRVWVASQQYAAARETLFRLMGAENLMVALQRQLVELIHLSLPSIERAIQDRIEATRGVLDELGEPVTTALARRKLFSKVQNQIRDRLNKIVNGDSLDRLFPGQRLPAVAYFEQQVSLENKSFLRVLNHIEDQLIDQLDDLGAQVVLDTTQRAMPSNLKTERNSRMRFDPLVANGVGDTQLDVVEVGPAHDHFASDPIGPPQTTLRFPADRVHSIENKILNRKVHHMQGFMEFGVFEGIVQELVDGSQEKVKDYLDRVTDFFRNVVHCLTQPPATQYVTYHDDYGVDAATNSAELGIYAHLQRLLLGQFQDVVQEFHEDLAKLFENERFPRSNAEQPQEAESFAQKKRKREVDSSEAERMLLRVHNYWTVARVRLVENICLTVRRVFVRSFLQQHTAEILQSIDDETLAAVAQEDDATRSFRQRLHRELDRFHEAVLRIQQTRHETSA